VSRWSQRRDARRAQRTIGAELSDDRFVRSGTVVLDRHGQEWQAILLNTVPTARGYQLWWREADAQTFRPPVDHHRETALDGKRFFELYETRGPLQIVSVPRRLRDLFEPFAR
jgi:hypothetical protein